MKLNRAGHVFLVAAMALAMALPLSVFSFAAEASVYGCGLSEHTHSAGCVPEDPVGDALRQAGLEDYDGRVYLAHRHGDACYAGGVLACPLLADGYLDRYPGVRVIHAHGDGCGEGCMLPDDSYEIVDGPLVPEDGDVPDGDWLPADEFVQSMPGGLKDTGPGSAPVYKVYYHTHGADCGDSCDLSILHF